MLNDNEFLKLVEEYQYCYKIGEIVKGRVISFEGNDALVDINAKTRSRLNRVLILLFISFPLSFSYYFLFGNMYLILFLPIFVFYMLYF